MNVFYPLEKEILLLGTKTELSETKWSFITFVVDMDIGISSYFNAAKEGLAPISSGSPRSNAPVTSCGRVIMGAKSPGGSYALQGEMDEIKFFYKVLTTTG